MPTYGKNDFKESNINYLNKDFGNFRQSLVNYAKNYFPDTYKDFNETSPGMMLMEMSAYVGDVTSFYIDQQYKEMLLPLAEERRNIINMAKMFGYKVKPIIPSYVDLLFESEVNSVPGSEHLVNYANGGVFQEGIKVTSVLDSDLIFETLEPVDFTISQSNDNKVIETINSTTQKVSSYRLYRSIKAVSGETKLKNFDIEAPQKFRKITLDDKNVIDIISVVDSNGNDWYEVDYLAQDKVPIKTHYINDESRDTAYYNLDGTQYVSDVPVPYSLEYIKTNKRFTRETNEDNTTTLVFGNGILKNGTNINEGYLSLEQSGIIIPGQEGDLDASINPLLGDEYSTLGETPIQTTLSVRYRVGGGINSNATVDVINQFSTQTPTGGNLSANILKVQNLQPARGGRDSEDTDEIREKAKSFFSTQNRCVTKEDYEARVLNIDSRYGSIAKVYCKRSVISELQHGEQESNLIDYLDAGETLLSNINQELIVEYESSVIVNNVSELISNFYSNYTRPTQSQITKAIDLGTISIYVLAYDKNKNLIGNPHPEASNRFDEIPLILKQNISKYIDNFRLLTDEISIIDGYVINFGVFFNVIAQKYVNKQEVKLRCIEKVKEYFRIENMQFSQPIFVSKLEYELMGVEGVRAVNYVTVTQDNDYNASESNQQFLPYPTFQFSVDTETGEILSDGSINYGYKYDFENALNEGVILPPSPMNPGVFELKNPNQNIKGIVK